MKSRSKLKKGAVIRAYDGFVSIGKRTSIGEYSVLAGHGGIDIGNSVIIAGHCYIQASEHIFENDGPIRFQGEVAKGIKISDGAWIGAGVVILDGVLVGNNTIIGASSLVNTSLNSDKVCFGVPCTEVSNRLSL